MNNRYVFLDASGVVVRVIDCPPEHIAAQVGPGEKPLRINAELGDRVVGGQVMIQPPKAAPQDPPDYVVARLRAYPPISAQLDALWHAMDSGQMPKAEPFYSQIKSVKVAYPKGMQLTQDLPPAGDVIPPTGVL